MCIYKTYLISAEGYKNLNVEFLQKLSKKEINTKNNKTCYVRNDVMTTIIKRWRDEKPRGIRAIDVFRNKSTIPDSDISKCPEFEVKSKIG